MDEELELILKISLGSDQSLIEEHKRQLAALIQRRAIEGTAHYGPYLPLGDEDDPAIAKALQESARTPRQPPTA